MAAQTPVTGSAQTGVLGDLRYHVAKFASVTDADTYVVPLTLIYAVSLDPGSTTGVGATWANGSNGGPATITFKGTTTNESLFVVGI